MNTRETLTVGVASFSPEDRMRRIEETFAYWGQAGPRAIRDATSNISAEWFLLHGIDPAAQHVDKTMGGVRPVPWAKNQGDADACEGRLPERARS